MHAKSLQSCQTPCDSMDCSLPGSSVQRNSPGRNTEVGFCVLLQGIFQTQGLNSGLPLCRQILYHLRHQGGPRILEWGTYHFFRGSSWPRNLTGVLHCTQLLYQLSYQGSPLYYQCHQIHIVLVTVSDKRCISIYQCFWMIIDEWYKLHDHWCSWSWIVWKYCCVVV